MKYSFQFILILLLYSANCISQSDSALIARLLNIDTTHKVVLRDCIQSDLIYYLNGSKIDIRKSYFNFSDIETITILKPKQAKQLYGDSSKGGVVLIKTKREIKFVSLIEELKNKGIDSSQIFSNKISIDNKEISNPDVLVDSQIQITLLFVGDTHNPKAPVKKEDFIGVIIFTNKKRK